MCLVVCSGVTRAGSCARHHGRDTGQPRHRQGPPGAPPQALFPTPTPGRCPTPSRPPPPPFSVPVVVLHPPWNDAFVPFLEEDADKVRGLRTLGPPRALSLPGAEGHKDGASPGLRGPFCGLLVRGRVDWFSWQVRGASWPRAGAAEKRGVCASRRDPALYPEDAKRIVRVGRSLGVSGRRQKTSGLPRARATGAGERWGPTWEVRPGAQPGPACAALTAGTALTAGQVRDGHHPPSPHGDSAIDRVQSVRKERFPSGTR